MESTGIGIGGGLFFLLYVLLMRGMIVGWIIFLIAAWRGMKAHESIASSLVEMAGRQGEIRRE